jgi:hypothetical protein
MSARISGMQATIGRETVHEMQVVNSGSDVTLWASYDSDAGSRLGEMLSFSATHYESAEPHALIHHASFTSETRRNSTQIVDLTQNSTLNPVAMMHVLSNVFVLQTDFTPHVPSGDYKRPLEFHGVIDLSRDLEDAGIVKPEKNLLIPAGIAIEGMQGLTGGATVGKQPEDGLASANEIAEILEQFRTGELGGYWVRKNMDAKQKLMAHSSAFYKTAIAALPSDFWSDARFSI